MDKILYENTEYINKKRQAICKKVGAINEMLDGLLEQLGCVLSDKEIMVFMNNSDDFQGTITLLWKHEKSCISGLRRS